MEPLSHCGMNPFQNCETNWFKQESPLLSLNTNPFFLEMLQLHRITQHTNSFVQNKEEGGVNYLASGYE